MSGVSTTTKLLTRGASRVPGLKRLPAAKLLALAEIAMLAQRHVARLNPAERRRFIALERKCRGRPSHLSEADRAELTALLAKVEPRRFVGLSVDALSPVPLPRRLVHGPKRR